MKRGIASDPLLLLLALLLALSLLAFLGGALPYPVGLLVLSALLVARSAHLLAKQRNR